MARSTERARWFSSSLPQTLQVAVGLLYFNAFLNLVIGLLASGSSHLVGLVLVVTDLLGGVGIANEKKWGYLVAIIAAALPIVLLVVGIIFISGILMLIFQIALVVLLVHPMSKNYARTWFR